MTYFIRIASLLLIGVFSFAQASDIPADTLGIDKQIDKWFAKIGNPVADAVFFAPKWKDEIQLKEIGVAKQPEIQPFTILSRGELTAGTTFYIAPLSGDRFRVTTRDFMDTIRFGDSIHIDQTVFTLLHNIAATAPIEQGTLYSCTTVRIDFLPIVLMVLLAGAIGFTVYFRFINFRKFKLAIDVVRGKHSNAEEIGEVSHFQALATALSGTVGLGNIAGVAVGISIGGAGATFWMIVAGLLGMSSKFVECTLGVRYRQVSPTGVVSGGPMYYLSAGLKEKGLPILGKILAVIFAIMCIGGSIGGGNMFQANQSFRQFVAITGGEASPLLGYGWVYGLILAGIVALILIGGIRSIARVTDKIVPFMIGIYIIAGMIILGLNWQHLPAAAMEILRGAFAPTAIAGGVVGVMVQGFRRACFSNEAGVGSASIAHAAVRTNFPASEGIVALLEPFIDTVIVCTMTALVIIVTGHHTDTDFTDGVALTSRAFASQIPYFEYVLSVAVVLFALSTLISWSYYGLKAWNYLFGDSAISTISYKVLFCGCIVIGAAAQMSSIINFSDAMILAMAFPNILGLVLLAPVVQRELAAYLKKIATT